MNFIFLLIMIFTSINQIYGLHHKSYLLKTGMDRKNTHEYPTFNQTKIIPLRFIMLASMIYVAEKEQNTNSSSLVKYR